MSSLDARERTDCPLGIGVASDFVATERAPLPSADLDDQQWTDAVEYGSIATMWPRAEGLRAFGFGDAGPMRQRLTALTLAGTKVATGDLWQQGYVDDGEAAEEVGERQAVLDDDDHVVAIIEITRVEKHRFDEVPWEFAHAEGEGFTSIEHWRDGHRSYFAKHGVDVDDASNFVCVWFRLVETRTGE